MSRIFIDTNVIAYMHDATNPAKRQRADRILAELRGPDYTAVISTQVLQELYNTLTRKFKLSNSFARNELMLLASIHIEVMTPVLIMKATDLHDSASISFWDALIVAAAQSADCDELWTEDMQTGRAFGKLKIVNPFAPDVQQLGESS